MSIIYYHPLGFDNCDSVQGTTYANHGIGKLDYGGNKMPLYAMCDGEVGFCGTYSDNVSCCAISCSENGLGETFYIRYLHGDYLVNTGDLVKQGQLIGYSSDHGSPQSYHLHIDFSTSPLFFDPVQGILNINNRTFTYKGTSLPIREDVDLNLVNNWMITNGAGGSLCGFCWLVMASKLEIISPDTPTYDSRMDVSKKMNLSENDWLAIYGMWQYEEGGIFTGGDSYEVAAGISEWVIRVFRNRLIAGASISEICLWNSGQPGRAAAEQKGKLVDEETRAFIRNIILGNNYFYVEKLALQYRYTLDSRYRIDDDDLWQRHLYAADTFSGASSIDDVRWTTLAAIPFQHGGYFFMEGEFSEEVRQLWNDGFYSSNPYFNQEANNDN